MPMHILQVVPHVKRVIKNHNINLRKYNYMMLFKGVKRSIKSFMYFIFPSELYPRDMMIRRQYLYRWRHSILSKYILFLTMPFNGEVRIGIMDKYIVGFIIWFGCGFKFPKKISRSKFQHSSCIQFIDVGIACCSTLLLLSRDDNSDRGKILKYIS
jgi:hypothetical protein